MGLCAALCGNRKGTRDSLLRVQDRDSATQYRFPGVHGLCQSVRLTRLDKKHWFKELCVLLIALARRVIVTADEAPFVNLDTSMGKVVVELYWKHAPQTCQNFASLAAVSAPAEARL